MHALAHHSQVLAHSSNFAQLPTRAPPMATVMQQLQRRIGAAKALLEDAHGSPRHTAMSGVQKMAVQELLQDVIASEKLTAEGIAQITERLADIAWADGHVEDLFNLLETKSVNKRRKQQQFEAATSYMCEQRWMGFLDKRLDLNARADYFMNFVAAELDCINPTEPTYKKWTSDVLVAHFDRDAVIGLQTSSKYALFDYIKLKHKKLVKHRPTPQVYLLELPSAPFKLHESQPAMYERLFPAGREPVQNKLDETLVLQIDNSYQCRGGTGKSKSLAIATTQPSSSTDATAMFQNLIPMLMQGMHAFAQAQQGAGPCNMFYPGEERRGARRSFKAMEDDAFSGTMPDMRYPGMRHPGERQLPPLGDRDSQLRDAASHRPSIEEVPGQDASPASAEAHVTPAPLASAEPPVPATSPVQAPSLVTEVSPGDVMLEAILARDRQEKIEAASQRATKREEAKIAKAEKAAAIVAANAAAKVAAKAATMDGEKIAAKAATMDGEKPLGKKGKRKANLPICQLEADVNAKRVHAESSSTPEHERVCKPSLNHERSRKQFLGRAGIKGCPSIKFKYGRVSSEKLKPPYSSEAAAKTAADVWLKGQLDAYLAE